MNDKKEAARITTEVSLVAADEKELQITVSPDGKTIRAKGDVVGPATGLNRQRRVTWK